MPDPVIYATFHKPFPRNANCSWIEPIAVGSASIPGIVLSDAGGDSISDRNASYCEVTAHYWVWKNRRSDFVGFYHYRRFLNYVPSQIFGRNPCTVDEIPRLTDEQQLASLKQLLESAEAVTAEKVFLGASVKAQYADYVKNDSWESFITALGDLYPKYARYSSYFDVAPSMSGCSVWVTRWDIFSSYMEELMPLLERTVLLCGRSGNAYFDRYPGFLAERFLNFWLLVNRIRCIEVPMVVLAE